MQNSEIRQPVQKRSIEKKEKIIKAGFDLICKDGYHNTNTAKIAKEAGVSTGIVYQYFKDKHDILIEGIKLYSNSIFFPMLSIPDTYFKKADLTHILKKMINAFVKNHKLSKKAHEEIVAMQHSDPEIAKLFYEYEIMTTEKITPMTMARISLKRLRITRTALHCRKIPRPAGSGKTAHGVIIRTVSN